MKQMLCRQHNSTENEIDQTNDNKLQIQTNINVYINKTSTQQIKFNPYQKYNDKEIQHNKNENNYKIIKTKHKHIQSTITARQKNQYQNKKKWQE